MSNNLAELVSPLVDSEDRLFSDVKYCTLHLKWNH